MEKELEKKLLRMVEKMPAFPKSVTRVMELTSDINCSPKELVQVIEHDPVMTMKILKLVNSAYFGLSRKIININHSVVFVGLNTIKNLALSIATVGILPQKNSAGYNINKFLLHSLTTGSVAKLLSKRLDVPELEATDYFVAGLLHDFGKSVLAQFMPLEFKKALKMAADGDIPLDEAEAEVIGADHTQIGAMLIEKWQLPEDLLVVVREHHAMGVQDNQMLDAVFAANQIIKQKKVGDGGNTFVEELPENVSNRFGMNLEELNASLGDISAEVDKARVFIRL